MIATPPPFDPGTASSFYGNISYGVHNRNVMDIWVPDGTLVPVRGIVMGFHGGGFVFGDKTSFYAGDLADEVEYYLNEGLAFVAINYRLVGQETDPLGVKKCFEDGEQAKRFLISNSSMFGIANNDIAIIGGSAGAGIAQYVGYTDTTEKVLAVGLKELQASYDFRVWDDIFSDFGIDSIALSVELDNWRNILSFLGFRSLKTITDPVGQAYQSDIDLLSLMQGASLRIWLESVNVSSSEPQTVNEINHHPLHARATREKAMGNGLSVVANIPELNVFDSTLRQEFINSNFQ